MRTTHLKVVLSGPTPSFDFTAADRLRCVLSSNISPTISGGRFTAGAGYLIVVQDNNGGWTINWPSNTANGPQPSAGAGSVTLFSFVYDEVVDRYYLSATPIGGQ